LGLKANTVRNAFVVGGCRTFRKEKGGSSKEKGKLKPYDRRAKGNGGCRMKLGGKQDYFSVGVGGGDNLKRNRLPSKGKWRQKREKPVNSAKTSPYDTHFRLGEKKALREGGLSLGRLR